MMSLMTRVIACLIVMGFVASANRPIRVFHGLGDDCSNFKYPENYPYIKCVETGAGKSSLTLSIEEMAEEGCKILVKEKETFQEFGVNFLCYSQGGIIARYILKICPEVTPFVRKVVFVGTPNLGITKVPEQKEFDFKAFKENDLMFEMFLREKYLNKLWQYPKEMNLKEIKKIYEENLEKQKKIDAAKSSIVDNELTAYFKDVITNAAVYLTDKFDVKVGAPREYLDEKLGESSVIQELSKPEMDKIYANLDLVLVILNQDERVIIPKESVTFGVELIRDKSDGTKEVIKEMFKSQYLVDHHEGLGKLYDENRLINCVSSSTHAQLNTLDFRAIFKHFLIEEARENQKPIAEMSIGEKNVAMYFIERSRKEFLENYPNFCQGKDEIPDEGFAGDVFDPSAKNPAINTGINQLNTQGVYQSRGVKTMGNLPSKNNPNGPNRLLTSQPNDLSSNEMLRIIV